MRCEFDLKKERQELNEQNKAQFKDEEELDYYKPWGKSSNCKLSKEKRLEDINSALVLLMKRSSRVWKCE